MNILFINEFDWFKSVVFDVHTFSEGLSVLGHQVYAIDHEWDENSRLRFRVRETRDVARVYPEARVCLRSPGFIKFPGLGFLSTTLTHYLEIRRAIRDWNIDAIILYSVLTNGLQSVRLARKFGIPLLFRNIDILHNLASNPRLRPVVKILEKRVYRRADMVLALTPKYAEYLIKMGAPESKVKLLLFPIDTKVFHPSVECSEIRQKWGLNEKDRVIVFVGALVEFGGLGELIRHFPEVIRQIPRAKLLIVGDGSFRPELERIIAELGLEEHVIITGYEPFQTMPQYINMATVCVNPFPITDFTRDLFSAKIIQYLACGRATISTSLPGITTLLPGESCGVVYTDSIAEMVREVVHLIESTERRHQLGQAGLNYVKQVHSSDKITRQLEAILEETIKRKQSAVRHKRV